MVFKVIQVTQDQQDLKEIQVSLVILVSQEQMALKEIPVSPVQPG